MGRRKIFGLISLMIISLLGIIWVQLIWINNAIAVRNDLFNRSVYQSLQTTARKIESSRNIEFFKRMMVADSILQSQASEMITNPFSSYNDLTQSYANTIIPSHSIGRQESFSIRLTENGEEIIFSGDIQTTLSNDSIVYIVEPELNNLRPIYNPNRGEMVVREDQFQQWIRKKSMELQNLGDQMINELYAWEVNSGVDANIVLATLEGELDNSGISTPFEFAIIENNRVIDGKFKSYKEADFVSSNFTVGLFPDRLIQSDTRLSLKFPDRKSYILGTMSLILGASSLFSLIILITFALSIFFIVRQKKISEMKSDFINNMTHEFKTPIATISLAADTIANPKIIGNEVQVRHFVKLIKKENVRMNKQVENILQISSLDKSEMEFSFDEVDLNSIVQRSIDTIEIQVEGKGGHIFFYPEAENSILNGDRDHLTNLVHNLLDNANKYSPTNPEITIRTESTGTGIKLSVEDKGMGMSKSVQAKIFERFYRESGGNVHNVKGFGLGLSYVRAIVEAHNGTIEVWSEPEKGTRFEVFLPQDNYEHDS